ncbi:MAG: GNAT family N-acetyltransferase [Panacagrimonas sp.]
MRIETLRGAEIASRMEALAELRIEVFREWPYLYAGSADYERKYLETYVRSARSLAILAWDGERCVGASTALPLADAEAPAQAPFRAISMPIDLVDYFGESVILRPWRGRGLGVKFFELREAHAREMGLWICAFCAVSRPADHPARPADYVPNDAFWSHRGYREVPGMKSQFEWPDVGQTASTPKAMRFWIHEL